MDDITTKDMYLAAILVSYGSLITSIDKTDPKKQFFHFDKLPTKIYVCNDKDDPYPIEISILSELKSYFNSKKLYFPPNFVDCLRSVKSYLYSE
jgi:hypothetical protein